MIINYSPNMIKTYLSCPKKFYYQYVEHLNLPKAITPSEKGKKIHALANYYLRGIKIDRLETALNQEERQIWELLKNNQFYNMDYINSEYSLMIKLDKFWIGGRIDAIVHNGNDYYILDYKTGFIPQNPEYDPQTMIYLLCVDKNIINYNKLSFVYINLKDKTNYVIDFNDEKKKQYTAKLVEICEKIESDHCYEKNLTQCKYCEYNKFDIF